MSYEYSNLCPHISMATSFVYWIISPALEIISCLFSLVLWLALLFHLQFILRYLGLTVNFAAMWLPSCYGTDCFKDYPFSHWITFSYFFKKNQLYRLISGCCSILLIYFLLWHQAHTAWFPATLQYVLESGRNLLPRTDGQNQIKTGVIGENAQRMLLDLLAAVQL